MNIPPPPTDWLKFSEAAALLHLKYHQVYHMAKFGTKPKGRHRVVLRSWMTPGGSVTTKDAIRQYLAELQP